jgi:hypothetical protein
VAGTTTLTLPAATDTLVGKATTDTLTNKTLTGAAITSSTGAFTTLTSTGASSFATSSGDVGIGTSSPAYKLDVQTTATGTAAGDNTVAFFGSQASGRDANIRFGDSVNASARIGYLSGSLYFYTNGVNRATIDTSGNLLVGTTATSVTGSSGFRYLGGGRVAVTDAGSTDFTTTYEAYSTGAGAFRFYVGLGGTIFATSIVITAISDERLKENVRGIDTGLDSIMALKPRRFDWKEGKGQDKKNVAGFIAQEFETVFPECVSTSLAGEDGIEYKNINHETLIPTLVKAIQELKAEFDAYKASHP